jgi:LysM repeat protein
MKPALITVFLVAALLSGSTVYSLLGQALADPIGSADQRARVYLFRGFAGVIFSRGMDALAEKIEQAGFSTSVSEAMTCPIVAKQAIADYRANPAPIVVVGHSVGAACALVFAEMLDAESIPVSLVVTTDPARIAPDVGPNVARYITIYQSNSVLGGRDVKPAKGFQGHYASYDLVEHASLNHLNIEKSQSIHEQVVAKIQQLVATPAKTQDEAVQLRYVVPADAPIELWDSGMPVVVRRGDTLQTLAASYGVPLWSLTQINKLSDNTTLAPGQRVVIPRHLLPLPAPTESAVSSQSSRKH